MSLPFGGMFHRALHELQDMGVRNAVEVVLSRSQENQRRRATHCLPAGPRRRAPNDVMAWNAPYLAALKRHTVVEPILHRKDTIIVILYRYSSQALRSCFRRRIEGPPCCWHAAQC